MCESEISRLEKWCTKNSIRKHTCTWLHASAERGTFPDFCLAPRTWLPVTERIDFIFLRFQRIVTREARIINRLHFYKLLLFLFDLFYLFSKYWYKQLRSYTFSICLNASFCSLFFARKNTSVNNFILKKKKVIISVRRLRRGNPVRRIILPSMGNM